LPQGVYTFGLWGKDSEGRRSVTFSTTFWIDDGTQTVVSDIVLPPTMSLDKAAIADNEAAIATGQSAPGARVELWAYPKQSGEPKQADIKKIEAVVGADGRWSAVIRANDLSKGVFYVKAKTTLAGGQTSGFGQIFELAIDVAAPSGLCAGADLNQDGRVNLTDFSILLYWWSTDNECADQNHDGTVNLTDFSIMMYYWTG